MLTFEKFTEALNKVPINEQENFVKKLLRPKEMLPIFGRFIFPHIIKGTEPVPECHDDLIGEINRREDSAVIFPRGHAKSTWEKIDTLHDIVYSLEPVILYIGSTMQDAGFHFESMKAELENNDRLIRIYGNLVPEESELGRKWTNKHFQTTNGVNCVARGAGRGRGVNIKNQRPTKIICDDIEDDDQVRSEDRRRKLNYWLYNVIFPSKDAKRGFIKMIGTIISPHCEILKFYKAHGGIFRKAIEDGKPIWPAMFSVEKLMEIKGKIGSRAFSQEYLNTPINEETAIIKPHWLKYYERIQSQEFMKYVIMFDPQSGEKEGADYYGLCVLGMFRKDKYRYVIRIQSGKDSQLNQAALLVRTFQEFPQTYVVGVEKVMTQVAVYQLILDWKAGKIDFDNVDNTNRNIPIIPVSPESKDKVTRLQMHEAEFERGEILLHTSMTDFADRLTAFPEIEHDDDVDSLIYAIHQSRKSTFTKTNDSGDNGDESIFGNVENQKF